MTLINFRQPNSLSWNTLDIQTFTTTNVDTSDLSERFEKRINAMKTNETRPKPWYSNPRKLIPLTPLLHISPFLVGREDSPITLLSAWKSLAHCIFIFSSLVKLQAHLHNLLVHLTNFCQLCLVGRVYCI